MKKESNTKRNDVSDILKCSTKAEAERKAKMAPYPDEAVKVVNWDHNTWAICVNGTRYMRQDFTVR
jgi:hypothetical protein